MQIKEGRQKTTTFIRVETLSRAKMRAFKNI